MNDEQKSIMTLLELLDARISNLAKIIESQQQLMNILSERIKLNSESIRILAGVDKDEPT